LPNTETSCEAATNCSNSAGFSSRTCDGCYPKPAMSSNWRASLVPAAAVIPAPRAYTDIAAVKTLVVSHWVAGLSRASLELLVGLSWVNTLGRMPCSRFTILLVRLAPAQSLLQWGLRLCSHQAFVWAQVTLAVLPWPTTGAHRQSLPGKLSVHKASSLLAGCHSMERQSIDQMWQRSCARPWCPDWTIWSCCLGWKPSHSRVSGSPFRPSGSIQPEMMGVLRV